jgi:hypothetical protein
MTLPASQITASSSTLGDESPDHSLDLPSLEPLSHGNSHLASNDFNADAFLLSRLHIPLEELRSELRVYLAELREELVQLINDDYEQFISLGTGLRGEAERLQGLRIPLSQITSEVMAVRDVLFAQEKAIQAKLDERHQLREEKVSK